jgi:flagellar hook-basal body complex protein FliE
MADFAIGPVTAGAVTPAPSTPRVGGSSDTGFGATLGGMLGEVNDLQLKAQEASVALAADRNVDTAQALVAIEKANISFQFALQIRNKLLEAYQEVMRMQV